MADLLVGMADGRSDGLSRGDSGPSGDANRALPTSANAPLPWL